MFVSILLRLVLMLVAIQASYSSNATSWNGRNFPGSPAVSVNLSVLQTRSVDPGNSAAVGSCDATCFRTEQKRGVSCAFVSSAGSLLSAKLGTKIDTHDIISRTIFAPTRDYESYVGSHTTARLSNVNMSDPRVLFSGDERIIFLQKDINNDENACRNTLAFFKTNQTSKSGASTPMSCFLIDFDEQKKAILSEKEHLTNSWTSGLISLAILSHGCDSLTAYGLRFTADNALYPYHYYENPSFIEAEAKKNVDFHNFFTESLFFRENSKCLCYAGASGAIFFDVPKLAAITDSITIEAYDERTGKNLPLSDGRAALRAAFLSVKT